MPLIDDKRVKTLPRCHFRRTNPKSPSLWVGRKIFAPFCKCFIKKNKTKQNNFAQQLLAASIKKICKNNSYLRKGEKKNQTFKVRLQLILQLKECKPQESTPHFYFTVEKNQLQNLILKEKSKRRGENTTMWLHKIGTKRV